MSFRALAISASRTTFVQPPTFSFLRGIPLAVVRWNSSTARGWQDRKPNYILLKPRIRSMLESTENLSYTQKLEKLREGLTDNSDLESTNIALTNIPSFVTVERVTEYVSKFGTAVECYPIRAGLFRVQFSSHPEAKKAVETINSATEYPIDLGGEYRIRLPLVADYTPPPGLPKADKPSKTIIVRQYAGEAQAVVDTFAEHARVVSSHPLTSHYHGVAKQTLFVHFNHVQDAEKVFSALDGKVTVDGHQYDLVYSREPIIPQKPRFAPKARWNK